jgi:Raf kinase inhibitor-like YbhB/YbcL family protein
VLYRIAYTGSSSLAAAATPPDSQMKVQTSRGIGVPLAKDRDETRSPGTLTVSSVSFGAGAPVPLKHSEYADGVSPHLQWTAVPNAKSYAIVMEDPDAKPITPFVHWVAWNIPASTLMLPEGLQEQPRLTDPEGMLQGRTSRGSPGWYGPRPPVGDPPHRYHFQVFALDSALEVQPGADRDTLLAAMKGHVLAKGELVGEFQQTVKPLK